MPRASGFPPAIPWPLDPLIHLGGIAPTGTGASCTLWTPPPPKEENYPPPFLFKSMSYRAVSNIQYTGDTQKIRILLKVHFQIKTLVFQVYCSCSEIFNTIVFISVFMAQLNKKNPKLKILTFEHSKVFTIHKDQPSERYVNVCTWYAIPTKEISNEWE